jgi:hypothetical protein
MKINFDEESELVLKVGTSLCWSSCIRRSLNVLDMNSVVRRMFLVGVICFIASIPFDCDTFCAR